MIEHGGHIPTLGQPVARDSGAVFDNWRRLGQIPKCRLRRIVLKTAPESRATGVPNTTVDGLSPKDFRRMAVEITNDTHGEVDDTVR